MTAVNWPAAQKHCRVMYTDLATVITDTDWTKFNKEAVAKHLAAGAWVGLYNDITSWRWSLDEQKVPYTNWYAAEPDNNAGKESCVIIGSSMKWWDIPCTKLKPFICYNGE